MAAKARTGNVLLGRVVKGGKTYDAGTPASDLDLTDDEKARLERLELVGGKKDLPDDDDEE